MVIYFLLGLFVILLVMSYYLSKKEIAQPAVIFCLSYSISIFCAVLNIKKWNISMNWITFAILLGGGIEFVAISYIIQFFFKRKEKKKNENPDIDSSNLDEENKTINVSNKLCIMIALYNIVALIVLFVNVLNIASQCGQYSNFSEALTIYKQYTSYSKIFELPGYVTIMLKPIISSAYIFGFIFLNNIIHSTEKLGIKLLKNIKYLIFPLMYIIQRLMESNRGSILNLGVGLLVMAILIWSIKKEWKEHIKIKVLSTISAVVVIALILFYYSASLIGRINNKGLIDYITFYIGGSIECFNKWIESPDSAEVVKGEYTFSNTINDLNKLKITNYELDNKNYSKFVYYNDIMVGNIYTAYRSWIHDWGILGVIILQAILSIVVNVLYYIIKYLNKWNKFKNYLIILYGYLIYVIFMHPIDSYFYLEFFTIANTAVLMVMTVMYGLITLDKSKIEKIRSLKWKKI